MFTSSPHEQNEYRAFCRNELAAKIDNDGGLCELDWIDCYYHKGTVYPDEIKLPIFSREHASSTGYAAYGAAVQLYTRERNGRVIPHRPTTQRFTLSYLAGGDSEQTYELLMDDARILWECTCCTEERQELLLCLNRRYLFRGTRSTFKDQHRGAGTTQIGNYYEQIGITPPNELPLLNGQVEIAWEEAPFDSKRQVLLYHGTAAYPYGTVPYVLAVGADVPATYDFVNGTAMLKMPWSTHAAVHVGMALAHTEEEAIASLRKGLSHYASLRQAQWDTEKRQQQQAGCVSTPNLPFAEEFGKATASYLDSLMVGPMPEQRIGVRASAGKYGFFSLWDTIYPIRDFLWNGRYEETARILNYLFRLPAMENSPIATVHLIAAWNEAQAFLPKAYREDLYPQARNFFRFALQLTEPTYHLLACMANTGVDHPEQMGLSGMFLSPEVNGLWYAACRVMENEAIKRGDEETARQAAEAICGIEQGYRRTFFNEEVGYFYAGVSRDLTPAPIAVYHNSLTMGGDYPYGMYLMWDMVPALAHYQSHELWHPLGHRAVAFDSAMPCDWWRYVHMTQHNGHEMKLQRVAGNMAEVYRVMQATMERSDRWKIAEETTNFSRFAIHPDQVCDWQSFGATAENEALRAGVAGITCHRGGLCYWPAQDDNEITVKNIPIGEKTVTVNITGTGAHAVLYRGETPVEGTLQYSDWQSGTGVLTVRRQEKAPSHPVLLCAIDLPMDKVTVNGTATTCVCGDTVHTPMLWFATKQPTMTVNGDTVPLLWDSRTGQARVDRLWKQGDCVTVSF